MLSKIDNEFGFLQTALGLRAQRQQVIAGNIANADTPNYKARDFNFATALKEAVAGRSAGDLPLATTAPGHLQVGAGGDLARLQYRVPTQSSADGNTVDMDVERAEFSENAIRYQAGLTFISGKIKAMTMAIQGQ